MHSSESASYGQREGTAYNYRFGCTWYHLFLLKQFGDVERCARVQEGQRRRRRATPEPAAAG